MAGGKDAGMELAGQAAAEMLQVIAATSHDLKQSLAVIAEKAVRYCRAYDAVVTLRHAETLVTAAHHGPIPLSFTSWPLNRRWTAGRSVIDRVPIHVDNLSCADGDYPDGAEMARTMGHRTTLSVPLMRNGEALGALTIRRLEVDPFSTEQISMLIDFSEHAAVVIENAQLFEKAEARNRELAATSEVLGVISRSPTDTQPVFDMIAKNSVLLCNAENSYVHRYDGSLVYLEAQYGLPPEAAEATRKNFPMPADDGAAGTRAIATGVVVQIPDYQSDPNYRYKAAARLADVKSALAVPMLRQGSPIGAIVLDRKQGGYFSNRQVELLKTFADQAVIAIENARLFEEVRSRNNELRESLEQQTATSEILRVIASSPTDIRPVLTAVAESAAKLCDAFDSVICLRDGDLLSVTAHHGPIPTSTEVWKVSDSFVSSRAVRDGKPVHVHDLEAVKDEFPDAYARAKRLGHRTMLGVPLLKDGLSIGVILIRRLEAKPFTQKQIDLSITFADQAAIAIENVRLFEEVQARNREITEALQQQTATAEVLKTISSSAFDLDAVLGTLANSAADLCRADNNIILLRDGNVYRLAQQVGCEESFLEYLRHNPLRPGSDTVGGRAALTASVVHVPDVLADPDYAYRRGQEIGKYRTLLGVPLMRSGEVIGIFSLARYAVQPFGPREISLVRTFADQAVIAIENVRLFEEVQARNREVTEALAQQTATADVLKTISSSAFDLDAVLGTLVKSAAELCRASNGIIVLRDDDVYRLAQQIGFPQEFSEYMRAHPVRADRATVSGRVALTGGVVHVPDVLDDPDYAYLRGQRLRCTGPFSAFRCFAMAR